MDPVQTLFAATKSLVPKLPALLEATTLAEFDAKYSAIKAEWTAWQSAFNAAGKKDPKMAANIGQTVKPILDAVLEKKKKLAESDKALDMNAVDGGRRRKGARKTRRRGGKAGRPDFFEPKPKTTRKRRV